MTTQNPETLQGQVDEATTAGITRRLPPMYVVLSAGNLQPEALPATSDEEAWETIKRRVRTGRVDSICLFKLVGAEVYTASSMTLSPEEVQAGKTLPPKT